MLLLLWLFSFSLLLLLLSLVAVVGAATVLPQLLRKSKRTLLRTPMLGLPAPSSWALLGRPYAAFYPELRRILKANEP